MYIYMCVLFVTELLRKRNILTIYTERIDLPDNEIGIRIMDTF